jgi:hypothetical protein
MNIQHNTILSNKWISNETLANLPIFHILVPGKQLCTQARNFLANLESKGFVDEPNLGSIFIYLLVKKYRDSHRILISFIAEHTALTDINRLHDDFVCNDTSFPFNSIAAVSAIWTICSHFKPVQSIIKYYRIARGNSNSNHQLKIFELQHGFVAGKTSILRTDGMSNTNPDIYLTIDSVSSDYIRENYLDVCVMDVGDILFSSQVLQYLPSIAGAGNHKDPAQCHLLVCFSERDIELGLVDRNYLIMNGRAIPREIINFVSFLRTLYKSVQITFRTKPHQNQSLAMPGFHYVKEQNSLAKDIMWADLVCSSLSAVSISASLVKIPSFFYLSRISPMHQVVLDKYSDSIIHISQHLDFRSLDFLVGDIYDWISLDVQQRRQALFQYAQSVTKNFYDICDSCQ